MRMAPALGVQQLTSGKFTAPAVLPVMTYLTRAFATSRPIAACASSVEPPMCGVRMTFGTPCSSAGVAVTLSLCDN